ncbi:hypothetical protein HHJ99_12545 (plasmid) [Staphylococcus caprae]|nr:hypothetical protein HHJ99_12545 [Staphylococcus caprae]
MDLIVHNRDLTTQEVRKLQSKYATEKKTEKRSRYIIQKIENKKYDEQLLTLGNQ